MSQTAGCFFCRVPRSEVLMPFGELLRSLRGDHVLVDVRRDKIGGGDLRGFVADLSDELVLLDIVDDVRANGQMIVMRDDISFLRWNTAQMRAWERAVIVADVPTAPEPAIDLTDWMSAITSLESHDRLLTFHRERMDESVCYLARDIELSFGLVVGLQVSIDGEEDGRFALQMGDLTRIDFGSAYERGLGLILGWSGGIKALSPSLSKSKQ